MVYQIALTMLDGVGDVNAKALLAYCGSASEIFRQKKALLQKIPGIGSVTATAIAAGGKVLTRAEQEAGFIQRYHITPLFFTDEAYPRRLKYCSDSPVLLYFKGNADLNAEKVVSIVGTRRPSEYGRRKTEELVAEMEGSGVLVISGLAYGVDVLAHKCALNAGLETVGVLGHGLDRIYPQSHDKVARKMLKQGGLLCDFMSETKPDAVNFPKRNRIVAGLCDALIVIESRRTGGSLITATIACSYNKDVFAFPGQAGDPLAEGCNGLIKRNKAALIESCADLFDAMGWQRREEKPLSASQLPLPLDLSDEQKKLLALLSLKKQLHIDELCNSLDQPVSKVSATLLHLEFNNLVRSKPGKMYEAV